LQLDRLPGSDHVRGTAGDCAALAPVGGRCGRSGTTPPAYSLPLSDSRISKHSLKQNGRPARSCIGTRRTGSARHADRPPSPSRLAMYESVMMIKTPGTRLAAIRLNRRSGTHNRARTCLPCGDFLQLWNGPLSTHGPVHHHDGGVFEQGQMPSGPKVQLACWQVYTAFPPTQPCVSLSSDHVTN
jgi:hypothetical protein